MHRSVKGFLIASALCIAIPGAAAAQYNVPNNASKACSAERKAMGTQLFKDTYGTNKNKSNAFGKCVSKRTKLQNASEKSAAKDCTAEQNADPAAFADKYGTGNKKNAFGRCVSSQTKAAVSAQTKADVNAARTCKKERKTDADAFKEKYGTGKTKRNAFGKCVSRLAKERLES